MVKIVMRISLLLGVILLAGCVMITPELTSKVDSRAIPQAQEYKTYWILQGKKAKDDDMLAFKEYSQYVDITLKQLGYQKAPSLAKANVVIFLSYGLGKPQNHLYTENAAFVGRPMFLDFDDYDHFGNTIYVNQLRSEVVYDRYIRLDAYKAEDYYKNKKLDPLWSVRAVSAGKNDDLRILFPYILFSMTSYIGVDSHQQVQVTVNCRDQRVKNLVIESQKSNF